MKFRELLEVTSVMKSFADKTGKSVQEVEKLWHKAKQIAKDNNEEDNYSYITGVLKNMLGIKD